MTNSEHYDIFFTADDLATEGIPYTLPNLISVGLFLPSYLEIADIEKIRYVGFIEFANEYNDVKLQGDAYWDISTHLGTMNHDGLLMTSQHKSTSLIELSH